MNQAAIQLKEMRESIGWSKSRLARQSGCSRTTIDRAEDISGKPKPETTGKLKDILATSDEAIIKGVFSDRPEMYEALHAIARYHGKSDQEEVQRAVEVYLLVCAALGR